MSPKSQWRWSPEFRRLLGFAPDDTKGFPNVVESWSDRLHPDDVEHTFANFGTCLNNPSDDSRYDVQYRLKTKTGEYRWFQAVGGVIHNSKGQPEHACGALIDIHRQKQEEEQASLLGEYAGVGLWDAILHEGDAMHRESQWEWSPEFRRLVGFEGRDFEGFPNVVQSWSDRIHPEDAEAVFANFAACMSDKTNKTPYNIEYRLKMKNGDYRWFQAVGGVARDSNGNPLRVCGSLIDIHEQKMAQAAYIEKLENLTQALETNVSEVADRASQSSSIVASAAEQLSASVEEMDPKVTKSAEESVRAFEEATQANATIHQLGEATSQISDVVDLIKNIASQTNLLALNATIEAARAGEVGKGFAVVAAEVKELAAQTAEATEDITRQVASLQSESENALHAIDIIENTMKLLKESSNELSRLMGEQKTATGEIAEQLAKTVEEINNVSRVISETIENAR